MSFSLAVENGDLVMRGSQLGIVHGIDKLKQDISLWLRERYRGDRFHSQYGSILDSFIGSVISEDTVGMVQSEVMRVLQNYQAMQLRVLRENPERFSADEVLVSIADIRTRIQYDSVIVTIQFITGSKQVGQLSVGVEV